MTGRRAVGQVGKVLLTLTSMAVVGTTWYGWSVVHRVQAGMSTDNVITPPTSTTPSITSSVPQEHGPDENLLLVGLDSRTDVHGNPLPQSVLDQLNAGPDDGEINTDTLIVVHIPGDGSKASAVSIPRDSYVDIAGGFGQHKINSAYAYGMNAAASSLRAQGTMNEAQIKQAALTAGRKNVIATVQSFTGVTINHYAEANLYGFDQISQALGGVPVCLNNPVNDPYSGARFPAGEHTLSGLQALQFVRQRHGLPNGDLDRERRQQAFLASATHQLLSLGTLTDPGKLDNIISAVQNAVVVDQNWNLPRFAQQMQGITGTNVTFSTVPIVNITYWTPADGDAVEVDPAQVRQFVAGVFGTAGHPSVPTQSPGPTQTPGPTSTRTAPPSSPESTVPTTTSENVPIAADGVTCVN